MDDTLTSDRGTWQTLFEQMSVGRHGQLTTIEVLDEELGDQTAAHGLPFESASYDARGDVIVIALDGRAPGEDVTLRHLIHGPVSMDLLEQPNDRLVLRVVDADSVQTLIVLEPAAS